MKNIFGFFLIITLVWSCTKDDEAITLSGESELISFSLKEIPNAFEITKDRDVETILNENVDLSLVTPVFEISEKAKAYIGSKIQTSGVTKGDFTSTVIFKVVAENGSKTEYSVKVYEKPQIKEFKLLELDTVTFKIEEERISAQVPFGTDLSELTAVFKLSEDSNVFVNGMEQVSGESKNDFSEPIHYELKLNGQTVSDYEVIVHEVENQAPVANAGQDKVVLIPEDQNNAKIILDGSSSSDLEGEIVSFEWIIGNNVIGNGEIIETELELGVHSVILKVFDSEGVMGQDDILIEVRHQGEYIPIDSNALNQTKILYNKMASLANSEAFAFGQEFPMSFQLNSLRTDLSTSDCKDVTGDHPGVYGIDPHYMLYKTEEQKRVHINEAKYAFENGSIVTFDFHQLSKTDRKIYFNEITSNEDKSLMYDIVNNNNEARLWFYSELDEVIEIINNDLGFPVVFRLFHEMDGDWFWWGTKASNHSPELYKQFYRLAVDYIKERTDLVLFGWTPTGDLNTSYYPGDTYVDVVGIDVYDPIGTNLKSQLINLSAFAQNHGKVAILAETGRQNYISTNVKFWTANILSTIISGGTDIRIAWVLSWFNAPWDSSQSNLFIPNINSSNEAKSDFIEFYNSPFTLFQKDIEALNVYN